MTFTSSWFGEGLLFSALGAQYSNKIVVGHRKVYNYRKNNPNSGTTVRKVQNGIYALKHSTQAKKWIVNLYTKSKMCDRLAYLEK